ncbi:MAG: HPF/RaiA family ribosome-associated protein [Acidimicrobiales bacterium]
MANDAAALDVHMSTRGSISDAQRDLARDKVARLVHLCREPVLLAQVRMVLQSDPARDRPAEVEAVLDIDGKIARAHVAAATINEAVDLVVDRLRRRIERLEDRRHRLPERRAATNDARSRHAEVPAQRPEYEARSIEEREVVRRKSFALEPLSLDEAAFDLDALAHDFYLFQEQTTMRDCVLSYGEDALELAHPDDVTPDVSALSVPLRLRPIAAIHMSELDARERLDVGHEPFVFFLSADNRGNVMYLRRDGNYGVIEAG